jgi:arylsulfatase A-like enzyme
VPANRPNVLWIVTTQWRAQAMGYAGDPNARTPFLDAFAAEAANFTAAVTPHPFGPFARAALFTGVASPQNGVRNYFDPLPVSSRTIAHALQARGYATAFFGKWHLWQRDPRAPLVGRPHSEIVVPAEARGGFEMWEGFESGFLLNDPLLHGTRLPEPIVFPGYQSDVVCERARNWTTGAGPWFCVVSLEAPHPPYDAPSAGTLPPATDDVKLAPNVPINDVTAAKARRELAGYYAHIEATDRAVGKLIAAVPKENTIVVFTSVHGDMHGAHGLFRKGWPYEESVRVPLLVRLPGAAARTDESAISLVDLSSMTLAWSDGELRWPTREYAHISMPSVVAMTHQCDRTWHGVRSRRRKLVVNDDGSPWLFFDLERDPWERQNLVDDPDRADEIAELRQHL